MVDGKCVEINGNFLLAGSKSVVGILEHKLGVAEGNRAFRAGLADLSSRRICADGAVRYQCVAAFYVVEHKLIGVGVIGDLVAALIFVRQSVLCYHIACLSFHLGVNGVETGILVGKFHLAHDGSETFLRFGKQIIGGHAELDCAAVYNGLVHKTGEYFFRQGNVAVAELNGNGSVFTRVDVCFRRIVSGHADDGKLSHGVEQMNVVRVHGELDVFVGLHLGAGVDTGDGVIFLAVHVHVQICLVAQLFHNVYMGVYYGVGRIGDKHLFVMNVLGTHAQHNRNVEILFVDYSVGLFGCYHDFVGAEGRIDVAVFS